MKVKELRDLIDFISKSGLDEVNIETPDFKISTKKNASTQAQIVAQPIVAAPVAAAQSPASAASPAAEKQAPAPEVKAENSHYIEVKSPMIGTFYRSSGPENPPFASEGEVIKAGQTVCIIEAMKLFNEIESEVSGKIVKVLVQNASPVEFDQPLFLVDPS
ncbi:MAG: acetyl-CoA carboxylase biotin carboxyl carrier protein [Cyclobacteriaceae bacterium]